MECTRCVITIWRKRFGVRRHISWDTVYVKYQNIFDTVIFSKKMSWQCQNLQHVRVTRGVQKVRSITVTRYAYHILSLFNIVTCNWNALGSAFLESSDTVVEVLLFLVFQPAICHAIRIRMANTVGDGVVQGRHFGWQPVLELTCEQVRCPGSK